MCLDHLDSLVPVKNIVSGLLFFGFGICMFGRLATCLDQLHHSLLREKNAAPHVSYCLSFFVLKNC